MSITSLDILRTELEYHKVVEYPYRLSKEVLEEYNKRMSTNECKCNYELFTKGINYVSKRKIKINGPTYKILMDEFSISLGKNNRIYFKQIIDTLGDETIEYYNKVTFDMYSTIKNQNTEVSKYNQKITDIRNKVNKFNKYEFVKFNKNLYGNPNILL